MGRIRKALLLVICLFLFFKADVFSQNIEDKVVSYTLSNGMKFLLMERGNAPVFTGFIMFKVGSVDENVGETGLAHLFEHMAFKGTDAIGTVDYEKEKPLIEEINSAGAELSDELAKSIRQDTARVSELKEKLHTLQARHRGLIKTNEFIETYISNGGSDVNAGTGNDITQYYVSLPSNKLELWMLMESERIKNPVYREFYIERNVVAEERRMRIDTNPFGKLYEEFLGAAFIAHPYGQPIVGWMSDIQSLSVENAKAFRRNYYSPNNAVGAVVGNIDVEETKRYLDKYFGSIPNRGKPKSVRTKEPEQAGTRETAVYFRAQPQMLIGYHKPTLPHYDDYVFDVINGILSEGRTSRLYASLVKEKKVAVAVNTYQGLPGARYDNLFVFHSIPLHPNTNKDVEKAVNEELERLKNEPVGEHELQKVLNQLEAEFVRMLDSNQGLASMLTYFDVVAGDWKYILRQREMVKKITADDIMRVANKYFTAENKVVGYLETKNN